MCVSKWLQEPGNPRGGYTVKTEVQAPHENLMGPQQAFPKYIPFSSRLVIYIRKWWVPSTFTIEVTRVGVGVGWAFLWTNTKQENLVHRKSLENWETKSSKPDFPWKTNKKQKKEKKEKKKKEKLRKS